MMDKKGFLDNSGKNNVDSLKIIMIKSLEGKNGKIKSKRLQQRKEILERANGKNASAIRWNGKRGRI